MSSHWKTLRKGNGSRNKSTYFCHCCAKENLNIALPNVSPCLNCCQPFNEHICYHSDVLDHKKIEELNINRYDLHRRISYASTMKYIQDTSNFAYQRPTLILYRFRQEDQQANINFINALTHDLDL